LVTGIRVLDLYTFAHWLVAVGNGSQHFSPPKCIYK